MNLSKYPRRQYTNRQTPIERLHNFSSELKGPNIYLKHDDMLGLTGGGNKTRKLEFVVGDALAKGADTLITCGGLQSNHCRLTASAAVKEKLNCQLVLIEENFQTYNPKSGGNNLLYNLLKVNDMTIISDEVDYSEEMEKVALKVKQDGGKPYTITMGASYPVGTLGYMACAQEIVGQSFDMGIHFNYIVCPSGSGGTQGGLIIGMNSLNYDCNTVGINVSRDKNQQLNLISELIETTIRDLSINCNVPPAEIECFDQYVGPGYAVPTDEMIAAVKRLASTEGVLLDPVYTGKAMAGLIDLVKQGYFKKEDNVLFLHTGGSPALYTCPELFIDK